jgi:hypothetical protein
MMMVVLQKVHRQQHGVAGVVTKSQAHATTARATSRLCLMFRADEFTHLLSVVMKFSAAPQAQLGPAHA